MADANVHHCLWGGKTSTAKGQTITDFMTNNDMLCQNTGQNTYISQSPPYTETAIDITFVSSSLATWDWKTLDDTSSDHLPIVFKINTKPDTHTDNELRFNYTRADWSKFRNIVESIEETELIDSDIDTYTENVTNALMRATKHSIPHNTNQNTQINKNKLTVPWWNKACQTTTEDRKQKLRLHRKAKTIESKRAYQDARNLANQTITQEKEKYWKAYCQTLDGRTSTTTVWKTLGKMTGKYKTKPSIPTLTHPNTATTEKEKANTIANQFWTVSSNTSLGDQEVDRRTRFETEIKINPDNTNTINDNITISEIKNTIAKKKESAAGEDLLAYKTLKQLPDKGIAIIRNLFQKIWEAGIIPKSWKTAIIIPIIKPGKNPKQATSYRPISLTSHLGKILETIVNNRLNYYLEKNNLYSPTQAGFRKNKSTLDQIVKLESDVKDHFYRKGYLTVAVFLDLSKAYDICWRGAIIHKAQKLGISGRMIQYINGIMSDRNFRVRIGKTLSETFTQENGIPQGSVISPTLFSILVNDMRECIKDKNSKLSQFADDSAIWTSAPTISAAANRLQKELKRISKWTEQWGLKINVEKTISMVFKRNRYRGTPVVNIKLNNQNIRTVKETTFLGMTLDTQLSWDKHINRQASQCKPLINTMHYMIGKGWGASTKNLTLFYKAFVRAKLDYGSIVSGASSEYSLLKIERIQNLALRIITGAHNRTPTEALRALTGIPPLHLRRKQLRLNYWTKVARDKHHINTHAFDEEKHGNKNGHWKYPASKLPTCWITAKEVKQMQIIDKNNIAPSQNHGIPTWILTQPNTNTELTAKTDKKTDPTGAKIETREMIERIGSNSQQIYTDGSKDEDGTVGAGFHIPASGTDKSFKLTQHSSIFTAEMVAIREALRHTTIQPPPHITILTDSLSAIQAINSPNKCSREDIKTEILTLTTQLHRMGCQVDITWIPSHIDIHGNDKADKNANKGRTTGQTINNKLATTEIKSRIKEAIQKQWNNEWTTSNKGRITHLLHPEPKNMKIGNRKIPHERKITRLILNTTTDSVEEPVCAACDKTNDTPHYLMECKKYETQRENLEKTCKELNTKLDLKILKPDQPTKIKMALRKYVLQTNHDRP